MINEASNHDWREWMRGLGRQARRVREFLGLSQEQIARQAGVSQGAVSRLEGGRGLATPLLVVVKLNMAMRRALRAYDPELLSSEARDLLDKTDLFVPDSESSRFAEYPLAKDLGVEDLVRIYRGLPERQREKLLSVVRVTACALGPGEAEAEAEADDAPPIGSRHAS
jgi:transcriptional regulator with XRE-family HTH domain